MGKHSNFCDFFLEFWEDDGKITLRHLLLEMKAGSLPFLQDRYGTYAGLHRKEKICFLGQTLVK